MTPFGLKVRELRAARGVALKEMATELHISSAYLSALEHGKRGRPSPQLIRQICGYFGIIWDEAEELERLADLSHPKVTLDTSDLSPKAVELANRLANCIHVLDETVIERLLAALGHQGGERGIEAKRRAGRR
jgi:transcriptional regulator with XRE-family HTH domain